MTLPPAQDTPSPKPHHSKGLTPSEASDDSSCDADVALSGDFERMEIEISGRESGEFRRVRQSSLRRRIEARGRHR